MSKPKQEDVASLLRIVADQMTKPDNVTAKQAAEILARRELERAEQIRDGVTFYALPPTQSGEGGFMATWPLTEPLKNADTK
jgi:hypothetical protein